MGFLSIKGNSVYLSVDASAKPVRPLAKEAISRWVRSIPSCTIVGADQKQKTLRRFTMVDAEFSKWCEDNPDPLWDMLEHQDKCKQNGERVDFGLRPQHILPVWSYADNDVKVIKQGNQLFEEMDRYEESGGDVTTCDWMIWFEGGGRQKKYKTSRQDPTQFMCTVDQQTLQNKMTAAMEQAIGDLTPFATEEDLIKYVQGDQGGQQQQLGSAPQTQTQVPGYTPGGQAGVALGGVPALPAPAPAAPMPGMPVQPGVPVANAAPNPAMPAQPAVVQPGVSPGQMPGAGVPMAMPGAAPAQAPLAGLPPQVFTPPAYAPPAAGVVAQGVPQTLGQQPTGIPQAMPATIPAGVPQAMPQDQPAVPNAPVTTTPVYAPPVNTTAVPQAIPTPAPAPVPATQSQPAAAPPAAAPPVAAAPAANDPSAIVVDTGKYKGHTLGSIFQSDPKYLTYLKGQKKDLAPAIEMILSNATPPPAQAAAPVAAPAADGGNGEEARGELVKAVNEKIMQVVEFQGTGVTTHMMPFLQEIIGTTNFSEAPLDKLQLLNQAIDQKLGASA